MFRKFALILTLTFLVSSANGQDDPRDAKYSPPEGSAFDQKEQGIASGTSGVRSAVQFHPLLLLRGVASLGYQRQIGESPVSLMLNTGLVFGKDGILQIDLFELSESVDEDYLSRTFMLERFNGTSGNRLFLELGTRVAVWYENNLEGGSIELKARLHGFRLRTGDEPDFEEGEADFNSTSFYAGFANTWSSGTSYTRFMHSLSYGVGYRTLSYTGMRFNENYSEINEPQYILGEDLVEKGFVIYLNYSLGIGW